MMIQLDFWHVDEDSRNLKGGLKMFYWVWSEIPLFDQKSGFSNQLISQERWGQSAWYVASWQSW